MGWREGDEFQRRNAGFFEQYKAGTLDIYEYVRFATQAVCEQGATKSIAAHARFMGTVVQKAITKQALELVQGHQMAGEEVVIVTATNEFVTRPIADAFGVKELIAIELERNDKPGGEAHVFMDVEHAGLVLLKKIVVTTLELIALAPAQGDGEFAPFVV